MKNIQRVYNVAYRAIFEAPPTLDYERVVDALALLGNVTAEMPDSEYDEFIWDSVGEFNSATLGDLVVGAYWHLTEWHGGQSSASYAAMCAIGRVFDPVMTDGPEDDSSEMVAYELLNEMAEKAVSE